VQYTSKVIRKVISKDLTLFDKYCLFNQYTLISVIKLSFRLPEKARKLSLYTSKTTKLSWKALFCLNIRHIFSPETVQHFWDIYDNFYKTLILSAYIGSNPWLVLRLKL